jgi:predicted ribosome quality control (RQC) complex YloA/Tae2 family protein
MTKDEIIELLKEYKQNKAKLNIKRKELKTARLKLKACDDIDISITSLYGENQYIHSKNKISNKVLSEIEQNDTRRLELEAEIKKLEEIARELRNKVEIVEDRLAGLKNNEKEVLIAYYVEGKTAEIIGEYDYEEICGRKCSGRYIRKIVKNATSKMINI